MGLYAQAGSVRLPLWSVPPPGPCHFLLYLLPDSSAVFAQKESPGAPPAFASPPDPWGRLHRSPLAFPAWVRPPETARTPGSDKERPVERREPSVTKEEKDRYVLYITATLCTAALSATEIPSFCSLVPAHLPHQGPPFLTAPATSFSCYS